MVVASPDVVPARYLSGGIDLAKFKQIVRKGGGTAPRAYSVQPERRRPATAVATPRAPDSLRGPAGSASPRPTFYPGGVGSGGVVSRPQSARFNQRTSFMGPNQVHRIEHRIVHIVSPLVVCPPTPQSERTPHSLYTLLSLGHAQVLHPTHLQVVMRATCNSARGTRTTTSRPSPSS